MPKDIIQLLLEIIPMPKDRIPKLLKRIHMQRAHILRLVIIINGCAKYLLHSLVKKKLNIL